MSVVTGDSVLYVFDDGTLRPGFATSDDSGDGIISIEVAPLGSDLGFFVHVVPYDVTRTRKNSWSLVPAAIAPTAAFYDIRSRGAVPGVAGQTATTAAINAIFADISTIYDPPSPPVGGKSAVIYVPATTDAEVGWYIGDLDPYFGNQSVSLYMFGDAPAGYGGFGLSTFVFNGSSGATMFDFVAVNSSSLVNLAFNGNGLAKYVVNARQFFDLPNNYQAASNGVYCENCRFFNPIGDLNSALFLAGRDDDPPVTLQAADYHFYKCVFTGHPTVQGWGFRPAVGGNTKQWSFDSCVFQYLYRGIEGTSGYLGVTNIEGANIGYNRDEGACLVFANATVNDIVGGGFENGSVGYMSRAIIAGRGPTNITGFYFSGNCPPDDYAVVCVGPTTIDACSLQNSRSVSAALPWTTLTHVLVGQIRTHDGGKWYTCVTEGITGATGPTGTGAGIADGSAVWDYARATGDAHIAKIQGVALTSGGQNPVQVSNCSIPYMDGVETTYLPLYDGSHNLITGGLAVVGSDYAKYTSHRAQAFGNVTYNFQTGATPDVTLSDFSAYTPILVHEQVLTDQALTLNPGQTVIRDDNGVFAVTVPAAVVAACIGTDNQVTLGLLPDGYVLLDAVMHVTAGFSGPAVTGLKLGLGTTLVGPGTIDILTDEAADVSGTYIGQDPAQRASRWTGDRCLFTPMNGTGFTSVLLMPTITSGAISAIDTGSVTVYLTTKRWGSL